MDLDADGSRDEGEPPLRGVRVSFGDEVRLTSDANGSITHGGYNFGCAEHPWRATAEPPRGYALSRRECAEESACNTRCQFGLRAVRQGAAP